MVAQRDAQQRESAAQRLEVVPAEGVGEELGDERVECVEDGAVGPEPELEEGRQQLVEALPHRPRQYRRRHAHRDCAGRGAVRVGGARSTNLGVLDRTARAVDRDERLHVCLHLLGAELREVLPRASEVRAQHLKILLGQSAVALGPHLKVRFLVDHS